MGSALAIGAAAESSSSAASSGKVTAASSKINIAFLVATLSAGYPEGMLKYMNQEAAKDNAKITVFNAQFNPQTQVAQCQDAITSGKFRAVITLPAASPPMVACAAEAASAHIPLVAANTPIGTDYTHFTSSVHGVTSQVLIPANTAWGASGIGTLLDHMCAAVKAACQIGLIEGVPALALTASAQTGVSQAIAAHPSWKPAGTCVGNYEQSGGLTCAQDLLQKDPKLNVLISQSDGMAIGAGGPIKDRGLVEGKTILIGTQGGSVQGVQLIKAGTWYGSIISDARGEGAIPVDLAVKAVHGETVPKFVNPNKADGLPLVFDQTNKQKYAKFAGTSHY
jgi:ribose transport system substrate-binding protein